MNLKNPYITKGAERVKDISEILWKNTLIGKKMMCNL